MTNDAIAILVVSGALTAIAVAWTLVWWKFLNADL